MLTEKGFSEAEINEHLIRLVNGEDWENRKIYDVSYFQDVLVAQLRA